MSDEFVRITELSHLAPGTGKVFRIHGRPIALFRVNGCVYALDNACPHRDGPLGEGTLDGSLVTCPRHGWQLDVTTGVCVGRPGRTVCSFPVRIEGDVVLVRLPAATPRELGDGGACQLLVRFGTMGYVGRFRAQQPLSVARGSRVIVQSSRGLELGDVLWCGGAGSELVENQPDSGIVIRELTERDAAQAKMLQDAVRPALLACQQLIQDRQVPVELIDAEQLFDGQTIVFYFLGEPPPVLADITNELARRFEAQIQFRPFGDRMSDGCHACHEDGGCERDGGHGCESCSQNGGCSRDP
jgi:nitrite reductase/ring-hydroxylating ferredoxin subunit